MNVEPYHTIVGLSDPHSPLGEPAEPVTHPASPAAFCAFLWVPTMLYGPHLKGYCIYIPIRFLAQPFM